jgi:FKBP-type peptidyl-prolyl cis-trans isomerase
MRNLAALMLALSITCPVLALEPETKPASPTPEQVKKDAEADAKEEAAKYAKELEKQAKEAIDKAAKLAAEQASKKIPVPDKLPVVKTTDLGDGLIAEDLKLGEGYEVKPGACVVIHYHGTLKADGKVFDSSFERGEPAAFPLAQLIPAWKLGVPGMKIGGVRRLIVPAKLGYGERGAGETIPPNSDLVFIIELVDAVKVEDLKVGDGEAATLNAVYVCAQTITGADGKEIDSSTAAKPFIWIPGENPGVHFALEGMKVGGKRKITIPKQFNKPQMSGTKMPPETPVTVELELIQVRNLPGR